jgi:cell division protein FtsL
MLSGPQPAYARARRQSAIPGRIQLATGLVSDKLRVGAFARIYVAAAIVLALLIVYVSLAAKVTATSYEITRLKSQQADLLARQEQLQYAEANLGAPGQVQQEASKAGMQRAAASKYVPYQPVAVDLQARPGDAPPDRTPLWARAMAGLLDGVTGTRDALAAGP